MKKTYVFLSTCLTLGLLWGCAPSSPPPPAATATPAPLTSTPTPSATLTDVPVSPTTAPTFTPPPTSTRAPTPTPACPLAQIQAPDDFPSGIIIFRDSKGIMLDTSQRLYSLTAPDLSLQPISEDLSQGILVVYQVSPDGKWVAILHEKLDGQRVLGHDLILLSSNPRERIIIPWNEGSWSYHIQGWLSDSQWLFINPRYTSEDEKPFPVDDEVILFNPFTQERKLLSLPASMYPEGTIRFDFAEGWGYHGTSVVYDPFLSRVAYLEDEETMVLWDLHNEQELWRFVDKRTRMRNNYPIWSPDGSWLALIDGFRSEDDWVFRILLVHRDGEIVKASEIFPHLNGFVPSFSQWSPDGRYLSFLWVPSPEGSFYHTILLEATSLEVIDYHDCFDETFDFPEWSPNGQQFALWSEEEQSLVIVDVANNTFFYLENIPLRPSAWITNAP